jgi:hypothetical protein
MQYFDPRKPGEMEGAFKRVTVVDPAILGHAPNLVIDPTKDFTIEVEWEISGTETDLHLNAGSANWVIAAYAESIGPGPEIILKEETEPRGPITTTNWSHTLTVPAPSGLAEENPGASGPSGVYKIVVTVFLNATISGGYDIAGFHEGPMIKVEDPE